jgi:sporulation protein YunB
MQPNLVAVNRIKLNALRELQGQLGPLQQLSFDIPAGQILGSRLFATRGPTIKVVVVHTGTVSISVREDFEAAGINQIRHALHLTAAADMQIVMPLHRETIQITSEVPLVESVIVGEVPDSYFNFRWNR